MTAVPFAVWPEAKEGDWQWVDDGVHRTHYKFFNGEWIVVKVEPGTKVTPEWEAGIRD